MNDKALFKITYGLYVLTAKEGDKDNGCIINTLQQVTNTPNRIAVTVNKQNYTHDMIKRTGEFNVSMIDETAKFDLFKNFGFQSGKDVNKLEGINAKRADNGITFILDGTSAFIGGKVIKEVDLGSHTMFIADVTAMEVLSDVNSVTYGFYQ
ncbi:MAG: flavin reductase family protein, partial [Bacilli bacterium]